MTNPYDILGVNKNASSEEIKSAFRRKAKEVHPDLNNNSTYAKEKFQELLEAYSILSDPKKRMQYDSKGFTNNNRKEIEEYVKAYMQVIQTQMAPYQKAAYKHMIFGLAWLFGGLIVTLGSYSVAASNPRGGAYIITWGAILWGLSAAIEGFYKSFEIKSYIKKVEKEMLDKLIKEWS